MQKLGQGSMFLNHPGYFSVGSKGGQNDGLTYLPPQATPDWAKGRAWNIDAELQGDCVCEQPYDQVTRVVNKEIVCHCPRNFVPNPPQFPGNPPNPTSMKYEDGCECVVADTDDHTICTCPLDELDMEDYDMHAPPKEAEEAASEP